MDRMTDMRMKTISAVMLAVWAVLRCSLNRRDLRELSEGILALDGW